MEKINITALGDSLTKGVVLNSENRYSILKGSFIDIISDKLNLCIKNYAKFGCTIGFGHSVIDRHSSDISASVSDVENDDNGGKVLLIVGIVLGVIIIAVVIILVARKKH